MELNGVLDIAQDYNQITINIDAWVQRGQVGSALGFSHENSQRQAPYSNTA